MAAARAEVGARETVCRGDPANPRQRRGVAAHGRGSRSALRGNFRKTSAGSQDISDPRGEAGVHASTTRTEASMQTRIPDLPRTARTTRNWRFGSADLPDPTQQDSRWIEPRLPSTTPFTLLAAPRRARPRRTLANVLRTSVATL